MEKSQLSPSSTEVDKWGPLAWSLLSQLRSTSPLVQCITNLVSMDLVANALLAVGSSPAMVHSIQEIPDFTPSVASLYINVGTLTDSSVPSMFAAVDAAKAAGRPWVLDPVAVSASDWRMETCVSLVGRGPRVVRGNASEIVALAEGRRVVGAKAVIRCCENLRATKQALIIDGTHRQYPRRTNTGKGADSSHESTYAIQSAKSLALATSAVVAVSGAVDFVTDGHRVVGVHNGVPMLQKITATGCAVTALIAAFVAVEPSYALEATVCALSIFGVAAEIGMEMAKGPGSLRMHMIDALYGLDEHAVTSRACIVQVS